jgi:preprotein translocase subunit SecA
MTRSSIRRPNGLQLRLGAIAVKLGRMQRSTFPIEFGKRIGRNDQCPCGSGKKFKECCQADGKMTTLKKS